MKQFKLIREWAKDRGIFAKATTKSQYIKLEEEVDELYTGIVKADKEEIKDAIGDCVVVLTILAHMEGLSIEECIDSAYTVISRRSGKMVNGIFVKDE